MRAEFDLAMAKGLYVIPVGSSGLMAAELWAEVMGKFDTFFPKDAAKIRPLLDALGKAVTNPNNLIDPILKLITHLATE